MRLRTSILLMPLGMALAACSGDDMPEMERLPGILRISPSDSFMIEVPDTAQVGVTTTVTVNTVGGTCTQQGDTEVSVTGLTAEIRPFDLAFRVRPANVVCSTSATYFPHRARVTFSSTGTATIRVIGLEGFDDSTAVVERQMVVR